MTKEDRKKIKYNIIHVRLIKKHGKANHCSSKDCQYKNPKRYEWALIKGKEYSENINDYIPLCPSCHRKYDETIERREKLSHAHKGKHYHGKDRMVSRADKYGNVLQTYKTIYESSAKTGIIRTAISNCLAGRTKTSGGFYWKYLN